MAWYKLALPRGQVHRDKDTKIAEKSISLEKTRHAQEHGELKLEGEEGMNNGTARWERLKRVQEAHKRTAYQLGRRQSGGSQVLKKAQQSLSIGEGKLGT